MAIDKLAMWQARMGRCDGCGREVDPPVSEWANVSIHVHHTLVYRSDLPRSKQHTENGSIDEPINLMLVCQNCHQELQSDRERGREFKIAEYGQEAVNEYLHRLLPKTHAARGVKGVK
jgi:predicted HNH restriction endonuclease